MKRFLLFQLLSLALTASIFAQAVPVPAPTADFPKWAAPAARLKEKTPFSPKPTAGDNIFKGEAEVWLAEAIIKLETGNLPAINDKDVSDYVTALGNYLVQYSTVPQKKFQFIVVNSHEDNAFSVGGGRIYVDLGMLQSVESEDELAGVMAHEIGHDAFGHAPKTVTRQLFWMKGVRKVTSAADVEKALDSLNQAYRDDELAMAGEALLGWARNDELQADKAGFYNMYKAGYNPEAMKTVFRRFVKMEKEDAGEDYDSVYFLTMLFGSHPPSSQRVTALKWESNWIKMPPATDTFKSDAFKAMKVRVEKM